MFCIITGDFPERSAEGDLFCSLFILPSFLGNIALYKRIIVKQPFLNEKSQGEFNPVASLTFKVLVFLGNSNCSAEESIFVSCILTVPLNNRIDRFEILEIKRFHSEKISVNALALFYLGMNNTGLAEAAGVSPHFNVDKTL